MSVTHGKLEGLITTPITWSATLTEASGGGGQLVSIVSGTAAYWSSAPAGNNFVTRMKAALEAASANGRTYTVTIAAGELGTGKVAISVAGDTFTLVWFGAGGIQWRDLCGFAGDLAPTAQSFAAPDHAKNLWLATGAQVTETGAGHAGKYESDARALVTAAGHMSTLQSFSRQALALSWEGETLAKTRVMSGAAANVACEQFWLDVIQGGQPWCYPGNRVRLHWDADSATYETYKVNGEMLEQFAAAQLIERHTIAWIITFDRLVKVP